MANSKNVDLMSVGQHCAEQHCGRVDFLPFKCDCCHKTFCLEHRTYEAHQCPEAKSKQTEAIVCPLCALAIKLKQGEDPNIAFERHQRQGCDTQNYKRVHKKKKCPVENCKEKLTTINCFTCKDCGTEICLKHRLPSDHKCREIQNRRKASQYSRWSFFPTTSWTTTTAQPSRNLPSKRETQEKKSESCQQCGARFRNVNQLIAHVETFHPGGQATDRCPHCGIQFSSAVQLVEHVESRSCQSRRWECAIS